MDRGQIEFVSVGSITFALVGLSVLILLVVNIYTLYKIAVMARLVTVIIRQNLRSSRARREIQERDRQRIARMIRRKTTDEDWQKLLIELGEEIPEEGDPS